MSQKLPTIPAQNKLKFRKNLSILWLLVTVRKNFELIKKHHRIRKISYSNTHLFLYPRTRVRLLYSMHTSFGVAIFSFPRATWEREPTSWSRGFSRWTGRDNF